ncbi:MAG TPA: hypothetical protein VIK18_09765 [Pirellulales bacterium]
MMVRMRLLLAALALVVTGAVLDGSAGQAQAQTTCQVGPQFDLFYNYYVGPPGAPAAMFVSPRPVPTFVGQTYITYQPLMPNEFLYRHQRVYRRYAGGVCPVNATSVRWW